MLICTFLDCRETVYTAYVQSNTRDLEERKQILLQLGRNYEQIEVAQGR